ncbi:hypothetical protein [Micromonospora sediminimaris]|uniref:Uncharacterized protein n=1 Tax=Micromonospora sediminimaris TaxID=547162 RepID=A0A9W5USR5_9ACTN|nr:hypothetical protein [Micromonospora sediminimaris]GIJ33955.1 hypothetical protein Vse01_31030 [Micromonospora sediminimaris]SFC74857.1 hypothetical protein SAMN05216284_10711 [Micromonospora sediminimaris]
MFGMRRKKESELARAVAELGHASTLAFGGVGIAGTLLPETEAYQRVAVAMTDHPEEVRDLLDRLLTGGTSAGRVYAATLLERLDPAAGRAAWTALRGDPAELNTMTGCVMGSTTVGEYAVERLNGA